MQISSLKNYQENDFLHRELIRKSFLIWGMFQSANLLITVKNTVVERNSWFYNRKVRAFIDLDISLAFGFMIYKLQPLQASCV